METTEQAAPAAQGRIWLVDVLRGLALLNMLGYHAMYDWVYIFGHASSWYSIFSPGCHVWQQYICWSFILLSGFSFTLARKPLKNGLLVEGCALVLTLVTVTVMPEEKILFGVLHFMGLAILISWGLRLLWNKAFAGKHLPAGRMLALCVVLFALTNQIPAGRVGFEKLAFAALPKALYSANLFVLGLPDLTRFYSADYFPLVPWLFLFWCGAFAAKLLVHRCPAALRGTPPRGVGWLCIVGSHTLLLYMLHQPVIYLVAMALNAVMT